MVSYFTTLFLHGKPTSIPQAVYQYLVLILLPVTANLLFLNQQKRENSPQMNVLEVRVDRGTACIGSKRANDQTTTPVSFGTDTSPAENWVFKENKIKKVQFF